MSKRIAIFIFALILLIGIVESNTLTSLGTFKQGDEIRITQVCSDANYINISSVSYPNSTIAISNIEMVSSGSGEYYYDFNLTSNLGRYDVRGISDGCTNTFATYFDVTPSGSLPISSGQGIVLFSAFGLIFILGISGFIVGFFIRPIFGKVLLISLGSILVFTSTLFTLLVMNEFIASSPILIGGFETFLIVIRIIIGLGIIGLIAVVFLVLLKAWRIRRGFS